MSSGVAPTLMNVTSHPRMAAASFTALPLAMQISTPQFMKAIFLPVGIVPLMGTLTPTLVGGEVHIWVSFFAPSTPVLSWMFFVITSPLVFASPDVLDSAAGLEDPESLLAWAEQPANASTPAASAAMTAQDLVY